MFQVGDRVCLIEDYPDGHPSLICGDIGTVDEVYEDDDPLDVNVVWDREIEFGPDWCVNHEWIELIEDTQEILINFEELMEVL